MIKLTDVAKQKLKEIADAEGIKLSIRVKVIGGGCSGFSHDMIFDEIINADDDTFDDDGIKIIVDQMSMQYLDDTTIDYISSGFNEGFKFLNDKIKSSCGCGSSVSY